MFINLTSILWNKGEGCLGGSTSEAFYFGSGHDLTVPEFEPRVQAVCWQLRAWGLFQIPCLPLSLPLPLLTLSLCLSKINIKKIKK